jgi:hypothetical protein
MKPAFDPRLRPNMADSPEHGWFEPRVAAFLKSHPERVPRRAPRCASLRSKRNSADCGSTWLLMRTRWGRSKSLIMRVRPQALICAIRRHRGRCESRRTRSSTRPPTALSSIASGVGQQVGGQEHELHAAYEEGHRQHHEHRVAQCHAQRGAGGVAFTRLGVGGCLIPRESGFQSADG